MEIQEESRKKFFKMLFIFMIVVSVYFAVKIFSEIKKDSILGDNTSPATLSFSGHGEVTAVPDIANIYFTISKDAGTVKDAQSGVAVVEKIALDLLKAKGVEVNDIKTADASFNPKYEYRQAVCPQPASQGSATSPAYYCPGGKQVIIGYQHIRTNIPDCKVQ